MGLSVIRTRGYAHGTCNNWGGDGTTGDSSIDTCEHFQYILQTAPGQYDERTFKKYDYIINLAKKYDIRLVFAFCDNWGGPDDSGSMNWYVDHSSSAQHHDEFYADEETRQLFKEHIETFLTRENSYTGVEYRDDPTVLMWELANEARVHERENLPDSDPGSLIGDWYREMAGYIKSLDSNHLVSTGAVGVYDPTYEGRSYLDHHRIDAIDAGSVHIYPTEAVAELDSGESVPCHPLVPGTETCSALIGRMAADTHDDLNKPIYVGEFGVPTYLEWDSIERGQQVVVNTFEALYSAFRQADVDGAMFYQLFSDDYFTGHEIIENPEVTAYSISYHDGALRDLIESYSEHVEEKSTVDS